MPLKLTCPRCKKGLTLPRSSAGTYIKCAHCGGRVWVPEVPEAGSAAPVASGPLPIQSGPVAPAIASGSQPPPVAPGTAPPVQPVPSMPQPPPGPTPPTPPPAPWTAAGQVQGRTQPPGTPTGHKAHFVTASTAQSRLQPSADGKLPGLQLEQDEKVEKPKEKTEGTAIHPLVLFCVLCLSVLVSITMVLIDVEGPQTDRNREQLEARWTIEREYFSHLDPNQPLVPYQLLLREAQRAHARGDREAERNAYRDVLRLLRAERGRFDGLTGSPSSDRKLEQLITTILQQ